MNTHRPLTLISAIVLLLVLSLLNLTVLGAPLRHPNTLSVFIYYAYIVFGVVGLIGVFGLWKLKRWGWRLTSILSALVLLIMIIYLVLALVLSDTVTHMVWALVWALCYSLLLVLVALPATRKAVPGAHTPVAQA